MKQVLLATTAVALCAAAGVLPANAGPTATGTLYEVASSVAANVALFAPTPNNVDFSAPSAPLSFNSSASASGYTIGGFLATGGATVGTPHGTLMLTDSLDNTVIRATGSVSVTTGEKFTFGHDDGVILTIGGTTVIDAPGATAFVTTTGTYTGPSGNQPFTLTYGECCGPPAVLDVNLPFTPAPEPAGLAILGTGLVGLGFMRYRKRR